MADWRVPLADVRVTEDDIRTVADVYRSGWLSMGPETERFENALAGYVGTRHALAVASGTAALHLICAAAGFGQGDEVVVPAMTFVATVNAIAYTGARPVFADIAALDRPWLSAAAAESAIGRTTRAILTMTYGGHPGETRELAELAAARSVELLEDTAHGIGARVDGRHLGTFGVAGAFSFFSNKNLAVGEGGALVTDDDELAQRARLLRSHGMTTLTWDRHRGHAAGYDVVTLGFNYRIDEPRAALARRRLERLDAENARRCELDERYRSLLAEVDGLTPVLQPPAGARSAPHLFVVVVDESIDRDKVRSELSQDGVQTSVHYPPVHHFSIYADNAPDLPVTDAFARRAITLPLFAHMTHAQQDLVVESVARAIRAAATA
jgi:dTDP-4-amino-4,6-dideoxygalactose transaminase